MDSVTEKIHLFNNKAAICFIAPRVVCLILCEEISLKKAAEFFVWKIIAS